MNICIFICIRLCLDEFKYCEGLSADWSRMERLVQARLVREETPMKWVWQAFSSSRES